MSEEQLLEDPTNRVVSVFDDPAHADNAREDFKKHGIPENQIRVMQGEDDGDRVDTSAKWFADTDQEIQKYQRELRNGRVVVSVPVRDAVGREEIHAILKQHNARMITHFGEWVIEMMK